jgi:hypothetical protein
VYDGATGTWLQTQRPDRRRLRRRRPRGLHRLPGHHPPRRHRRPAHRLLRGGRRRGGDQHLRRLRRAARRVRHGRPVPRDRQGQRPHRPGGGRRLLHPGPQALRGRLARPGTKFPEPRQIRFAELRDHYQVAAEALLEGASTCSSSRRTSTCSPSRPRSSAPGGPWPRSAARCRSRPGHHGAHRPHARGHRDRAALAAIDPMASTSSASTAPPAPPRWASTCATSPSTPACRSRCCPTPACRRWSTARCTTTSPPSELEAHQRRFVEELGVQVIGGCCGTTPEYIKRSPRRRHGPEPHPRPPTPVHGRRSRRSTRRCPDTRTVVPDDRRAHQRQRLQGSSARRCSPATTTRASPWPPRTRSRTAPTSSTCASTTWAATAPPTWTRSPALRHPANAAAGARLHRARGHRGRAAVGGRPGHPQLGQPRGRRRRGLPPRPGVQAGQGVRRRRHLPAHRRGGPGPRRRVEGAGGAPHHDLAVDTYGLETGDLIFDASPSRSPPATTTCAATPSRPSRPSAHQGRDPRLLHHPRRVERQLRPVAGGAPRAQQRVPARVRGGRLDSAIVHASKILPLSRIPEEQRDVASTSSTTAAAPPGPVRRRRVLRPAAQVARRLRRRQGPDRREGGPLGLAGRPAPHHRIIDGDREGLTDDLDEAMAEGITPLASSTSTCSAA